LEQILTIAALVFGVGLAASMVWIERRPKKELKVSLVPTTPFMFIGALIAIVAVAYLLAIYGIKLPERGSRF
jgi:hypothetical protein